MMNYFMKHASKLLKHRKRWMKIYRVLWPISLSLFLITVLWMIVSVGSKQIDDSTLCRSKTYLSNQASTLLLLLAFAILGFYVTLRVK